MDWHIDLLSHCSSCHPRGSGRHIKLENLVVVSWCRRALKGNESGKVKQSKIKVTLGETVRKKVSQLFAVYRKFTNIDNLLQRLSKWQASRSFKKKWAEKLAFSSLIHKKFFLEDLIFKVGYPSKCGDWRGATRCSCVLICLHQVALFYDRLQFQMMAQ